MKNYPILVSLIIALLAGTAANAKYSGGTGDPNDPYQIATIEDLLALATNTDDYSKCFITTADINLQGQVFTTALIASDIDSSYGFQGTVFTGKFDGGGHTIAHLTINGGSNDYLGLFGLINTGGEVKNLGLEDCNIGGSTGAEFAGGLVGFNRGSVSHCYSTSSVSGSFNLGGLVGYNTGGSISRCHSTATVSGSSFLGGLVGETSKGSISDCYSTCAISGSQNVGGLVGYNNGANINYCNSAGSVSGSYNVGGLVGTNYVLSSISHCDSTVTVSGSSVANYVGGLAGDNEYASITDCYSTGPVNGYMYLGGFVGQTRISSITNCYSTGSVRGSSGSRYVAGLVGYNEATPVSNCYSTGLVSAPNGSQYVGGLAGYIVSGGSSSGCFWDTQTSGQTTSAGGTPKTTEEMKTGSTFTEAGWDFADIWGIVENQTYPYLRFAPAGDLNYDKKVNLADLAILASHWLEEK